MAIAVAGTLSVLATNAMALADGKVTVFADETVSYSDNVFQLPSSLSPPVVNGSNPRSDWYYTTTLGVTFDVPVSRQKFQGGYTWNDTHYNHYDTLDYTGHDGRIVWLWQIGNDASGHLGYSDTAAPASFASVQTRTSDILTTRIALLDGEYRFTPSWRLKAGAQNLEQSNSGELNKVDDIKIITGDLALSYVSRADNTLGVAVQYEDGDFPNRQSVQGSPFAKSYTQWTGAAVFDWTITGKSALRGRAGYANRNNDPDSAQGYSGFVGRLEYEWKPTGKSTVLTVARREIDPYQNTRNTFMLVKGITITPQLRMTDKLEVSGVFDYSERVYLGAGQLACGIVPNANDRIGSATLTLLWRPAQWLALTLSGQYQDCSSGTDLGNYRVGIGSLGARISF